MNKRWIAYKLNITDIVNGNYVDDGFIQYGEIPINRVRIMGTVVQKFIGDDDKYGFFILDDGTETIRIRSFQDSIDLIKNSEIGEIVDVFGRIRKYNDELYVIPEIVKKVEDPNFWVLRKLELSKQEKPKQLPAKTQEKKEDTTEIVVEEMVVEEVVKKVPKKVSDEVAKMNPRQRVVNFIQELDKGEGVEVEHLIEACGLEGNIVENVLTDLMNEGEIFEPRAGKVKILA